MFSSLFLRLLLFLFISIFCLLINACWSIHLGFHLIISYLVSMSLFKGQRVLVQNCSFVRY